MNDTASAPPPLLGHLAGARIGVLGYGRSGRAVAEALRRGGAAAIVADDTEAGRSAAAADGFDVGDFSRPAEAGRLARLIVSPGAPHFFPEPHPAVAAALSVGLPLDNDVGLFLEAAAAGRWRGRIAAITGTNGKSTTSALLHHLLGAAAGREAYLGGNIGRGVFDLPAPVTDAAVTVLELSSYQIDLARRLDVDVAAFLNLQPDHLDRHGGFGGYLAAKAKLFAPGAARAAAVSLDDAAGRWVADRWAHAGRGKGALWEVSAAEPPAIRARAVAAPEGLLRLDGVVAADLADAPALRGRHNAQNAAAAAALARLLGVSDAVIADGMARFPGLAHRMERLGADGAVEAVNDSKATNADAARQSLSAFDNIRWIAGGRAKEGGIESLAPLMGRVRKAYFYGECRDAFADTLAQMGPEAPAVGRYADLAAATDAALSEAEPGDVALLAPAAASFDQFPDFEARGEAFRALVAARRRR